MSDDISPMDRTAVNVTSLVLQGQNEVPPSSTFAERIGVVWQLTMDAWASKDPSIAESRFQRHVVSIVHRGC